MKLHHKKALKIIAVFFIISFLWIMFSDKLLFELIKDTHRLAHLETYKGWFYIIIVSVIIYLLVSREAAKTQTKQLQLDVERTKYKSLFENANDAILIFDEKNRIIECNNKAAVIFECSKDDLLYKTPIDLSPETQIDNYTSEVFGLEKINAVRKGNPQYFEWLHTNLKKDKIFPTEVSLNKIEINGKIFLQGIIRDIKERKEIEKDLVESEERYKAQYNYFPIPVLTLKKIDNEYIFTDVNNATKKYPYIKEDSIIGKRVEDFFTQTEDQKLIEIIKEIFKTKKTQIFETKYEFKTTNSKRILSIVAGYVPRKTVLLSILDITDKKDAQRKVYYAMINAEERERTRVAKELHDGVSPILSAIKLYVQTFLNAESKDTRMDLSQKIIETINEAVQSVSDISNRLSPHILQNFGLATAINSFIEKIMDTTDITFGFYSNLEGKIDENIEINLYRIVIELINNTVKYAKAKYIKIRIEKNRDIILTFEHNGIGFDVEKVMKESKGMGLKNLFSRIDFLNGKIYIKNNQYKGLKIKFLIPIED